MPACITAKACMLQSNERTEQREELFIVYSITQEGEYRGKGKFPDEVCQAMGTCHHSHEKN